jgi:serine/threonine-protein kinase
MSLPTENGKADRVVVETITSPPRTIGPFTIVEQLPKGGMATVYRCVDPVSSKVVAVKVANRRFYEDLQAESQALRRLRHRNIIRILPIPRGNGSPDVFVDEDVVDGEPVCFVALECIDGGSLQDHLVDVRKRGQPLTPREIVGVIETVGGALDYAHQRQVVHRDVKPSNILLTKDGRRAVLTDFGIGRSVPVVGPEARIGTAPYMSPEQARSESVDARSDLYSLGVLLYQLCVGRLPFEGSPTSILRRLASNEPAPSPRWINPAISPALEAVILRSMHPDPGRRYPSAAAMVADLKKTTAAGPHGIATVAAVLGSILLAAAIAGLFLPAIVGAGGASKLPPGSPVVATTVVSASVNAPLESIPTISVPVRPSEVIPTPTVVLLAPLESADVAVSETLSLAVPTATLVATPGPAETPTAVATATLPPNPPKSSSPRSPSSAPTASLTPTQLPQRVLSLNAVQYPPGSVLLTWSLSGALETGETYDVQVWRPDQLTYSSIANTDTASWRIGGAFPPGDYSWSIAVIRKVEKTTVLRAGVISTFHWSR